ncbi:hypothetical protein BJ138DRAFT_1120118 [Hygrophoropsis aurantiaca]|uniref:Uncharacterized protein n=1 Tax=Hygrophoropsis aurantiaca TaxID=72124 RepID=A0ACB7ZS15_9AGAM|nr:hypothetical protein BJ138DRAFT_1120118 [Hygrophoropsis aurantiaca]
MHNKTRCYIGRVLDLYKNGTGSYRSVESVTSIPTLSYLSLRVFLPVGMERSKDDKPTYEDDDSLDTEQDSSLFTGLYPQYHLTPASDILPASDVLHHLGKNVLTGSNPCALKLTGRAAVHWKALIRPAVKEKLLNTTYFRW